MLWTLGDIYPEDIIRTREWLMRLSEKRSMAEIARVRRSVERLTCSTT